MAEDRVGKNAVTFVVTAFFHSYFYQNRVTYNMLPTRYLCVTYLPNFSAFYGSLCPILFFCPWYKRKYRNPNNYGTFKPSSFFILQDIFRISRPSPLLPRQLPQQRSFQPSDYFQLQSDPSSLHVPVLKTIRQTVRRNASFP